MKTTGVVHLGNIKLFKTVRDNLSTVLFALVFTLGVLISVILVSKHCLNRESEFILDFFNQFRTSYSFSKVFFIIYIFEFTFIFFIFIFSTSLFGIAFIPAIVFMRGTISGLLLCGLYSTMGLTGISLNLLTLIPSTVINVLSLISAASYGLEFSYTLSKIIINNNHYDKELSFKTMVKRISLPIIIIAFGSLLEVFSMFVFKKFFI